MANKKAYLKIEGDIGKEDELAVLFDKPSNTFSAKNMSDFISANKDADEFHIDVRSDGGDVDEAFDIHDQLVASGKKIFTYGYRVASAATIPFMAAPRENRLIAPNALFLPHFPLIGLQGYFRKKQLEGVLEDISNYQDKVVDFYAKDFGIDGKKVEELKAMMDKDIAISAEEAIKWGFAGGTIDAVQVSDKVAEVGRVIGYSKAIINAINKNSDMEKLNKETVDKLNGFQKFMAAVGKKLGLKEDGTEDKVQATTAKLKDGTPIYFDGELATGTKVFTDDAMTVAVKDGDHELEDGRTITVKNGAVDSIADAPVAKTDAEKLKEAKDKIAELEKEVKAKNDAQVTMKADMKKIMTDYAEIQKTVMGGGKIGEEEIDEVEFDKLSPAQKHRYIRNQNRKIINSIKS